MGKSSGGHSKGGYHEGCGVGIRADRDKGRKQNGREARRLLCRTSSGRVSVIQRAVPAHVPTHTSHAQTLGQLHESRSSLHTPHDPGMMIFADKRYQRHDKRDKLPQWITRHLKEAHMNLSTDMMVGGEGGGYGFWGEVLCRGASRHGVVHALGGASSAQP